MTNKLSGAMSPKEIEDNISEALQAANSRCPASAGSVLIRVDEMKSLRLVCDIALDNQELLDGNDAAFVNLWRDKLRDKILSQNTKDLREQSEL